MGAFLRLLQGMLGIAIGLSILVVVLLMILVAWWFLLVGIGAWLLYALVRLVFGGKAPQFRASFQTTSTSGRSSGAAAGPASSANVIEGEYKVEEAPGNTAARAPAIEEKRPPAS